MDWKALGNCRGEDPNSFYPENNRWAEQERKKICRGCPVFAQCMDHAIRYDELGIWGGTTDRERRKIKARYVRPSASKDLATALMSL
jgi:WhiB family redox-sensing transcriptional regulator